MLDITLNNMKGTQLVKKIKELIDRNEIITWKYDEDGDFTATQDQWRFEAWLRPKYDDVNKHLYFGIVKNSKWDMSKEVYAVYHGRFAEMLLAHFDTYILNIEISSMLISGVDVFES